MAYYRKGETQTVLVMGNFQTDKQDVVLPSEIKKVLINNCENIDIKNNIVTLEGYQLLVVEI